MQRATPCTNTTEITISSSTEIVYYPGTYRQLNIILKIIELNNTLEMYFQNINAIIFSYRLVDNSLKSISILPHLNVNLKNIISEINAKAYAIKIVNNTKGIPEEKLIATFAKYEIDFDDKTILYNFTVRYSNSQGGIYYYDVLTDAFTGQSEIVASRFAEVDGSGVSSPNLQILFTVVVITSVVILKKKKQFRKTGRVYSAIWIGKS